MRHIANILHLIFVGYYFGCFTVGGYDAGQFHPIFIVNIIVALSYATVVKAPGTKSYNFNLPNNQLVNNVGTKALNVMYNQHKIAPLKEQPSTVNLL